MDRIPHNLKIPPYQEVQSGSFVTYHSLRVLVSPSRQRLVLEISILGGRAVIMETAESAFRPVLWGLDASMSYCFNHRFGFKM